MVTTSHSAKYLGVFLDNKLTYGVHLRTACEKASAVTKSLSRLMANLGGPSPAKRRLLMLTVQSVLLYGAEIWGHITRTNKYRQGLVSVQRRSALRIASSYRTVSGPAIFVIAGVIPIDLLAQERQAIYVDSATDGRAQASVRAREQTMEVWQSRWENETAGRWTARLIKQVGPWFNRGHGDVSFWLTQFLSGHGYFRSYLAKHNKVTDPTCRFCGYVKDDARHTFFVCPRFAENRLDLADIIGDFSPDSIIETMLGDPGAWRAVSGYVEGVLLAKRDEGCLE